MSIAKTVLITGASSGIGLALAREYSRRGAELVLLARRKDLLDQLAKELKTPALTFACDVTQATELEAAVKAALARFGKLDVVIANAGFGVVGRFEELSIEDYHRQFATNVFGVLHTVYATLGELKKTRGVLAIMGSVAGHIASPEGTPYSMSKFAVRAFADGLRGELFSQGVSVTLLSPGFVESEIRKTDNQGQHHAHAREPIPAWLVKSTPSAAREMVRAIEARKSERIITFHGKVLVGLKRFVPWVLEALIHRGVKSRPEPRA